MGELELGLQANLGVGGPHLGLAHMGHRHPQSPTTQHWMQCTGEDGGTEGCGPLCLASPASKWRPLQSLLKKKKKKSL